MQLVIPQMSSIKEEVTTKNTKSNPIDILGWVIDIYIYILDYINHISYKYSYLLIYICIYFYIAYA